MPRKQTILIASFIIIAIILILLPIKYPRSIQSKGKLFPFKTWTLTKGTDGRLLTSLVDNSKGINSEFSVTQFERGDAIQFKLNLNVINKNILEKGDTVGYVISNIIEKDIEKLRGELETAKALLNIKESSEKESVIETEKKKLIFAQKELEEQTKIYDRKKKLVERDLISQQEFEADEAKYELAKINISIAKERLKSVQSGSKAEEIDFASSRISALVNEISVLQRRYESNNIVIPISGLLDRTFSPDTLLVINDTSKYVAIIPINLRDSKQLRLKQRVEISSDASDSKVNAEIISLGNNVNTAMNTQYVLVTAISKEFTEQLKPGLYVDCNIECNPATALEIINDFIRPFYK